MFKFTALVCVAIAAATMAATIDFNSADQENLVDRGLAPSFPAVSKIIDQITQKANVIEELVNKVQKTGHISKETIDFLANEGDATATQANGLMRLVRALTKIPGLGYILAPLLEVVGNLLMTIIDLLLKVLPVVQTGVGQLLTVIFKLLDQVLEVLWEVANLLGGGCQNAFAINTLNNLALKLSEQFQNIQRARSLVMCGSELDKAYETVLFRITLNIQKVLDRLDGMVKSSPLCKQKSNIDALIEKFKDLYKKLEEELAKSSCATDESAQTSVNPDVPIEVPTRAPIHDSSDDPTEAPTEASSDESPDSTTPAPVDDSNQGPENPADDASSPNSNEALV